jgi:dihydrofolate synthase/folylpolyglutamate synthase
LDSTNVITPLLSVITNISFDHMDMLGNTLPLIAGEKAGIIKPGVPVVIGETHPETAPVFLKKAAATGSVISFADQAFSVTPVGQALSPTTFYEVTHQHQPWENNLAADVRGPFQSINIATLLQAAVVLEQVPAFQALRLRKKTVFPFMESVCNGLAHLTELTRFQGRWQIIGTHPTVLCDSAHNEAGLSLAMAEISRMPWQRLHIVTGFVNDKDLGKALRQFPATARYYFAKANIPRGLNAAELATKASELGLQGKPYSSVKNALKAARHAANADDLVVVIGSIFVVAEVI